jgi:transcriptional regulator with XRE-family HTH domain
MSIERVTAYVRSLRIQKRISQSELARHMGLSVRQVSRWETGESRDVSSEALLRAMIFLDASFEQIVALMELPTSVAEPLPVVEGRAISPSPDSDLVALLDIIVAVHREPAKFAALMAYARSLRD